MVKIAEMQKHDIPYVVSFLKNSTEEFMNQWGGARWYKYPVTLEQMITVYDARNSLAVLTIPWL